MLWMMNNATSTHFIAYVTSVKSWWISREKKAKTYGFVFFFFQSGTSDVHRSYENISALQDNLWKSFYFLGLYCNEYTLWTFEKKKKTPSSTFFSKSPDFQYTFSVTKHIPYNMTVMESGLWGITSRNPTMKSSRKPLEDPHWTYIQRRTTHHVPQAYFMSKLAVGWVNNEPRHDTDRISDTSYVAWQIHHAVSHIPRNWTIRDNNEMHKPVHVLSNSSPAAHAPPDTQGKAA